MRTDGAPTIEQLLARYSHAVDDRRFDDVGLLFAPDGELHVGRTTFTGRNQIIETLESAARSSEPGKHVCSNVDVDITDDVAAVVSDFGFIAADRTVRSAGRYIDELRRIDDRWFFAGRRIKATLR